MGKVNPLMERNNAMVTLVPVDSSMLASVGYDTERQYLLVLFNTGKAYEYYDVPQEDFDGLMAAESKGGFMREHILERYPYSPFRGWKNQQQSDTAEQD